MEFDFRSVSWILFTKSVGNRYIVEVQGVAPFEVDYSEIDPLFDAVRPSEKPMTLEAFMSLEEAGQQLLLTIRRPAQFSNFFKVESSAPQPQESAW